MGGSPSDRSPADRPRHLIWVTTELRTGGAERCLTRLARELPADRYRSTVVSLKPLPVERTELLETLRAAGIPVRSLDASRPSDLMRTVGRLRRLFDDDPPDLLASFLFHANVVTAWARRSRPTVPWLANLRVADPSRWRSVLERRALTGATRIACVSRAVAEAARRRLRLPSERLVVIPNGVDLTEIDRQLGRADGAVGRSVAPRVAVVGRLEPQKGLDRLFEAWGAAPPKPTGLRLGIVGQGSERERLEALARRVGIADVPIWYGWRSEPWETLRETDVVLVPSRFEGMANAMLEAMGAGKVVLATDVEGVRDVLDGTDETAPGEAEAATTFGPHSQIIPVDRLDLMLARLTQVLADKELATRVGAANRRRIETRFAWETVLDRYVRLFDSLV